MKKFLLILFIIASALSAQVVKPGYKEVARVGYQIPVYVGGHAAGDSSKVYQPVADQLHGVMQIDPAANDIDANITNSSLAITGTVAISNPSIAVTGTFWQATQPVSGTFFQAKQPINISQTTTDNDVDANITNSTIAVTGTVAISNPSIAVTGTFWQATQPVSGTFWQATQPVSGTFFQAKQPINISQTTTDNDVDANITNATLAVTQSGTWTVQPGNTANTTAWLMKLEQTGTSNDVDVLTQPVITDKSANANSNVIGNVSLGNSQSKTVVMKTGNLVTTAVTADQVILTYTVTSGKTFYLQFVNWSVRLTTYAVTATNFGTVSIENPSGTKIHTALTAHAGVIFPPYQIEFSEPIPITASTVIRIVCTPAATTSFTWQGNFGGYEK